MVLPAPASVSQATPGVQPVPIISANNEMRNIYEICQIEFDQDISQSAVEHGIKSARVRLHPGRLSPCGASVREGHWFGEAEPIWQNKSACIEYHKLIETQNHSAGAARRSVIARSEGSKPEEAQNKS